MKKCKVRLAIVLMTVALTMVAGCSKNNDTGAESTTETVVETMKELSEKEILDMVDGIKDWYIIKDSKNIDLSDAVKSNSDVIKKIEVDDSKVDLTKIGTYKVTYMVTVSASALDKPEIESKEVDEATPDESQSESVNVETKETENVKETKAAEKSNGETESKDTDNAIITVEKEVHVVTKEEGQKIADKGIEVLSSDNKLVEKSDSEETKKETKSEKDSEKRVTDESNKSNNKYNTSSGNTSGVSGNNTDNNSSAPAVGTSSEPAGNTASSTRPSGNNNSQPSGTGSSTPAPSGGTSSTPAPAPAPSTPQTQAPETTSAHKHNWIEKTRTVHHDATGHYEDVVVQEAWDEPVYETVWKSICNGCGADITSNPSEHIKQQMLAGNMACSGHTDMPYEEIMGYTHHDAVTESRWVEDTPAWDETVSNGYVCSGCGAVK